MTDPNKKEITTIVKQVLKETGRVSKSSHNPSPTQNKPSGNGPAVLNIFHAGVRKLEEALQQVQQIEETARRSSVYTVESARAWVCGADVKEGAGVKCILDTVKPDGLEKALQKADILILPTFCLRTGAKIASLTCDDQASNLVFTALLLGKKVLATNDGFMLCDILVNEQLRSEIDRILEKLEGFGMIFCQTDQLHATFQNIISGNTRAQSTTHSSTAASEKETAPTIKLVTAKLVHAAVDNKQRTIRLATGGIITPLARDLAKEYSIQILKSDE